MLIVNGLLTALPVVIYNDLENIGVRIGSIPVEDFFYCFILLLMNISLYEYFQKYSAKQIQ
jgi:lycopene cyclase domain-containing protein